MNIVCSPPILGIHREGNTSIFLWDPTVPLLREIIVIEWDGQERCSSCLITADHEEMFLGILSHPNSVITIVTTGRFIDYDLAENRVSNMVSAKKLLYGAKTIVTFSGRMEQSEEDQMVSTCSAQVEIHSWPEGRHQSEKVILSDQGAWMTKMTGDSILVEESSGRVSLAVLVDDTHEMVLFDVTEFKVSPRHNRHSPYGLRLYPLDRERIVIKYGPGGPIGHRSSYLLKVGEPPIRLGDNPDLRLSWNVETFSGMFHRYCYFCALDDFETDDLVPEGMHLIRSNQSYRMDVFGFPDDHFLYLPRLDGPRRSLLTKSPVLKRPNPMFCDEEIKRYSESEVRSYYVDFTSKTSRWRKTYGKSCEEWREYMSSCSGKREYDSFLKSGEHEPRYYDEDCQPDESETVIRDMYRVFVRFELGGRFVPRSAFQLPRNKDTNSPPENRTIACLVVRDDGIYSVVVDAYPVTPDLIKFPVEVKYDVDLNQLVLPLDQAGIGEIKMPQNPNTDAGYDEHEAYPTNGCVDIVRRRKVKRVYYSDDDYSDYEIYTDDDDDDESYTENGESYNDDEEDDEEDGGEDDGNQCEATRNEREFLAEELEPTPSLVSNQTLTCQDAERELLAEGLRLAPPLKLILKRPLTEEVLRVRLTYEKLLSLIESGVFDGEDVFCAVDIEATGPIGHEKCRILAIGFALHVLGTNTIYTFAISIYDEVCYQSADRCGGYRRLVRKCLDSYHLTAQTDEHLAAAQLSRDITDHRIARPEHFSDKPGDSWWDFMVKRNPVAFATILEKSIDFESARLMVLSIFTALDDPKNCAKLRIVSDNPSYDLALLRMFFTDQHRQGEIFDVITYPIDTLSKANADGREGAYHFSDPAWLHTRGPVWCPDSFMGAHDPFSDWVSTDGYFKGLGLNIYLEKSEMHVPDTDAENMMRSFIGCYQVACLREQELNETFQKTYPELAERHQRYMQAARDILERARTL